MDDKTDTSVRSEGAELFVQAYLMLELGIPTTLASRNMPGYDLIAHNIETGKNCRLQVKYRKAINSDGARVKHFGFDFMVYVAGNIGKVGDKRPARERERKPTEVYVVPVGLIQGRTNNHGLYKSPTRGGHDIYKDAWHLVEAFLNL